MIDWWSQPPICICQQTALSGLSVDNQLSWSVTSICVKWCTLHVLGCGCFCVKFDSKLVACGWRVHDTLYACCVHAGRSPVFPLPGKASCAAQVAGAVCSCPSYPSCSAWSCLYRDVPLYPLWMLKGSGSGGSRGVGHLHSWQCCHSRYYLQRRSCLSRLHSFAQKCSA